MIDLCDYYILIIGHRYGSLHPETGISYTEMEYNYAIEKGIPVLVFSLDTNVSLPPEKCEDDPEKRDKLNAFRSKAMTNRLASIWTTLDDLTGKLAISIMKATKEMSRPGWQRGTDYDEASLRRDIMSLQEETQQLQEVIKTKDKEIAALTLQTDLAFEDYEIKINYVYYINDALSQTRSKACFDIIKTDLKTLFKIISMEMLNTALTEALIGQAIMNYYQFRGEFPFFSDKQFIKKILNQFQALGLIQPIDSPKDTFLYWMLTPKGVKMRDDLTLYRKAVDETTDAEE